MKNLILLKLGGSLITDKFKPYTARIDVIKRVGKEIYEALEEKPFKLIIGNGGGSFPHVPAKKYRTVEGILNEESWKGFSIVHNAAAELNKILVEEFLNAGLNAVSLQPSACCIAKNDRIIEFYTKPIEELLKNKVIPVVYGDVGIDVAKGCCILSTEEILAFLAERLRPEKIVLAGKVDGVYGKDGKLIKEITSKNFHKIKSYLKGSDGIDVSGGMLLKITKMLELAQNGIESLIINGLKKGYIKRALLGKEVKGTVIK